MDLNWRLYGCNNTSGQCLVSWKPTKKLDRSSHQFILSANWVIILTIYRIYISSSRGNLFNCCFTHTYAPSSEENSSIRVSVHMRALWCAPWSMWFYLTSKFLRSALARALFHLCPHSRLKARSQRTHVVLRIRTWEMLR